MSNAQNDEKSNSRRRFGKGQTVALVSLVVVAFLAITKAAVGFLYGSIALLADAVNSFSDILASGLVWSGLTLSQKEPTERFPYGYYRAETLASLVVSALIIFSGIEILWEAVRNIRSPIAVPLAIPPLAAAALSMILYYALFRYKKQVGSEIDSKGLVADAKHSLADVASGFIVFIGILLSGVGYPIAEVAVAILVGIIVVKEGFSQAKDAVLYLMDACLSPEMVSEMRDLATKVKGITDVHDVRLRRAGPVYFGEMHIT
ncbi:MAG: cation diffusion facilitator family transporter, partial [Candidatus Thorarchaeota archaeon]